MGWFVDGIFTVWYLDKLRCVVLRKEKVKIVLEFLSLQVMS